MIAELDALTLITPIWARTISIALVLLGITYIGLKIALNVARMRE